MKIVKVDKKSKKEGPHHEANGGPLHRLVRVGVVHVPITRKYRIHGLMEGVMDDAWLWGVTRQEKRREEGVKVVEGWSGDFCRKAMEALRSEVLNSYGIFHPSVPNLEWGGGSALLATTCGSEVFPR